MLVDRIGSGKVYRIPRKALLQFDDGDSEVWKNRLTDSEAALAKAIPAVGRIELSNNPRFDWVVTGWLVDEDIVVTNRHVAKEFARRSGERSS